jgi:hypothetical protein
MRFSLCTKTRGDERAKKSCGNFLFASRIAREIAMKKRLERCARNTRMGRCRTAEKTETVNAQCDFTKSNLAMKNTAKPRSTPTVKTRLSRNARDGQATQNESARPEFSDVKLEASVSLLPRVIRLKDAPRYLGMDRNRFNTEVRPGLVELPIGRQGIGFDRLDLDAWFDAYKKRNGRPGRTNGERPCARHPDSDLMGNNGSSTNASRGLDEFSKELASAKTRLKRRNSGSMR